MNLNEFVNGISSGRLDEKLKMLYGPSDMALLRQRARYLSAAESFSRLYPNCGEIRVFSASGRSEIGGNHTDHQHGCVLAAAIDLDAVAIVTLNGENVVRIKSEGYPADEIDLDELEMRASENGTSAAIIRGILFKFSEMGVELKGFDAYTSSDVISGSGLSSSAAFEVLIGTIVDSMFNAGKAGAVEIAKIGQYAENVYFGKASGLMDQMVSSVGGFVYIDFNDPSEPDIQSVQFDFARAGYSLCVTDTRGSHAGLSDEYSAVSAEMRSVAKMLGAEVLRECDEEDFYEKLPDIRKICSDRAVLRAAHFFYDNRRAGEEADALRIGDTEEFFRLVNESGRSSGDLLQNLFSVGDPTSQQIPVAIMMSRRFLGENGAVRVHGGGFAGTIQAFVPTYLASDYSAEMERIFGKKCCYVLNIRPVGGYELEFD